MVVASQGACASSSQRFTRRIRLSRFQICFLGLLCSVAVLAFAYVGYAWSLGLARNVWLVNGLDRGYDVSIDGKTHHLMPHEARQVPVSEGQVHLASADPTTPFPDQTIRVTTPLLTRAFAKPVIVVNPDRTALVYEEEAAFVREAPKSLDEMGRHKLVAGAALYQFDKVDYAFEDFPDSVSGADGSAKVLKKKIALWTIGSPIQQTRLIEKEAGHEAAVTFVKNLAMCNPEDQSAMMLLATVMPHNQIVSFLRSRLDVRPVQVVWHRTYQQIVTQVEPKYDLIGQYRAMVKAEPDNSSLMYLLARVVPDRAESEKWLRKSTNCAYPSGYGFFALAYRDLSRGDFENALIAAQEAATLLPDNLDAKAVEAEALTATGHYDRLLNRAREAQAHSPTDPRPVMQEIQLLALQKDPAQAQRVRQAFISRASAPGKEAMIQRFALASSAMIEYAGGNLPQFLATLEHGQLTFDEHFEYDLSLGRIDDAAADLSTNPGALAGEHLTLAVTALDAGRYDVASRQLQLASAGYAKGDNEMRRVAQWLAQQDAPNPDDVCDVALMPDQKRLLLAAMGLKDPMHRERYFRAAAALNYDRAFPYLEVKQVLDNSLVAMK
jgi:hypothetical protein